MADDEMQDGGISVLDDKDFSPEDTVLETPEFQIYTGRPSDVTEASHYALTLTCHSLQKRNIELRRQLSRLQRSVQKQDYAPDIQKGEGPIEIQNMCSHSSPEDYAHFLEGKLTDAEQVVSDLRSKLEEKQLLVHHLQEQVSSQEEIIRKLHLGTDELKAKNRTLSENVSKLHEEIQSMRKLEVDLSSMQHLYESLRKTLKTKESSWNKEREELKGCISELQIQNAGVQKKGKAPKMSITTQYHMPEEMKKELAELEKELAEMRTIILQQTSIIKTLKERKENCSKGRGQDTNSPVHENVAVYCEDDLVKHSEEEGYSIVPRSVSFDRKWPVPFISVSQLGVPDPLTKPPIFKRESQRNREEPDCRDNTTSHTAARPKIVYPPNGHSLSGLSADNNRLLLAEVPVPDRHIEYERNISDPVAGMSHPSNHTQNVNLNGVIREKQATYEIVPEDDAMDYGPLASSKPVPTDNIYTEVKTCPVCEQYFPADVKQAELEDHVKKCINSRESHGAGEDLGIKECPVCSALLPPGTNQEIFESHVNSHFENEYEILS